MHNIQPLPTNHIYAVTIKGSNKVIERLSGEEVDKNCKAGDDRNNSFQMRVSSSVLCFHECCFGLELVF
jgi:hypothetical protein